MKKNYEYLTNCVNCPGPRPGEAINDMVEVAKDVSRSYFLRLCRDISDIERSMGYAIGAEQGLHMKNDYHVTYHTSRFRGRKCIFFVHSCIEYIFVQAS